MVTQYIDVVESVTEEYLKIIDSFKVYKISETLEYIYDKLLSALKSDKCSPRVRAYFDTINPNGEPFTNFEDQPDNVSQIKKILNALYHGRLAFKDLESINIRSWLSAPANLSLVIQNTVNHAYQACYLITHPDVNLIEIFNSEKQLLAPIFAKVVELGQKLPPIPKELTDPIQQSMLERPLSGRRGVSPDLPQNRTYRSGIRLLMLHVPIY